MKPILFFILAFLSVQGYGQTASQVQAKNGIFTERLFLRDRWIDRITNNLVSPDSANGNLLATATAVNTALSITLRNQFSVAQSADFYVQGTGIIGSHPGYKNTLASGYAARLNITHGNEAYGLSIQRAGQDNEPADLVFFKNYATDLTTGTALTIGDPIGSINFAGIAGNNTTVATPMSIYGYVEKSTPSFLTSGFIFNTTDVNGANVRRMGIIPNGSLMVGNATVNPYKLNVVNGNVRFNSLAESDVVLAGSNNDGVVNKVALTNNAYVTDSTLYFSKPDPARNYVTYSAILTQAGQDNPTAYILDNSLGESIEWTRDATGQYTGTVLQDIAPGSAWFHSHPSDPSGTVGHTRLFRGGTNTIKLIVKDTDMVNKDGWTKISVEVRFYTVASNTP